MVTATGPFRPWLSIWTQPRETIRRVLDSDYGRGVVLLLAALGGVDQILNRASFYSLGDEHPVVVIIALSIAVGVVWGLLLLYVGSLLLRWTGRWIGGTASGEEIRAAIAWSNVPLLVDLALWLPGILIFGRELFTSYTPRINSSLVLAVVMMGFGLLSLVLAIWGVVIFLQSLGEVQGFSAWKALGNALLATLVGFMIIVVLSIPVAVLFA